MNESRNKISQGLPGASFCYSHYVSSLKCHWPRLCLDWCRRWESSKVHLRQKQNNLEQDILGEITIRDYWQGSCYYIDNQEGNPTNRQVFTQATRSSNWGHFQTKWQDKKQETPATLGDQDHRKKPTRSQQGACSPQGQSSCWVLSVYGRTEYNICSSGADITSVTHDNSHEFTHLK